MRLGSQTHHIAIGNLKMRLGSQTHHTVIGNLIMRLGSQTHHIVIGNPIKRLGSQTHHTVTDIPTSNAHESESYLSTLSYSISNKHNIPNMRAIPKSDRVSSHGYLETFFKS